MNNHQSMANENRLSLHSGYKLRDYTVLDILGQGGFGITYLARDNSLDRLVAIKEYLPMEMAVRDKDASIQPVSNEYGERFKNGLERFVAEARILAKFRHPNIVQVYNIFSVNNTAYIVMEYEYGQSLASILKQEKILSEKQLKLYLFPIMKGLEMVHQQDYIHRDIKPANIFIREDASPVLLDFGSARQALAGDSATMTTMFSPGFAPFEQYTGKSINQGPWTDIYGLAATLYKALTGRAPADALDRGEALLQTDRDIYVSIEEIDPPDCSKAFLKAIDQALQFRPSNRPISISAWLALLQAEESDPPIPDYSKVSHLANYQPCTRLTENETEDITIASAM